MYIDVVPTKNKVRAGPLSEDVMAHAAAFSPPVSFISKAGRLDATPLGAQSLFAQKKARH